MILTLSSSPVVELRPVTRRALALPAWPASVAVLTAAATAPVVTSASTEGVL